MTLLRSQMQKLLNAPLVGVIHKVTLVSLFLFVLIAMIAGISSSCSLFYKSKGEVLTELAWTKESVKLQAGGMYYLKFKALPSENLKKATITHEYDKSLIKISPDTTGVVIEGLKNGTTPLVAKHGSLSTTCMVTVDGYDQNYERDPYIYSAVSIVQLQPSTNDRVAVSLFGGKAEDTQNFTWQNENPSVAEIAPNGQFCLINAKAEGNTKLTISHPKAQYPYSILVYVFPDAHKAAYITTDENILFIKQHEAPKTVAVRLENFVGHPDINQFKWKFENEAAAALVCSLEPNADKAVLKPIGKGTAKLCITHPKATYPLEILVQVVTIVQNVYIEPSETFAVIDGAAEKRLSVQIKGLAQGAYSDTDFTYTLDDANIASMTAYGKEILITGKLNGLTKITVHHPMTSYPREIMVSVKNQKEDSVYAGTYVTTSQNYIRTKVGASPTELNVILKGGIDADEKKLRWVVAQKPASPLEPNVIKYETTCGEVAYKSRSADDEPATFAHGNGYITPLAEGTATITITHPKAVYPTDVLVKVLPSYAILEAPLYFSGPSIVTMLTGQEKEITVELRGNVAGGDEQKIAWEASDASCVSLAGNAAKAVIKAVGSGPCRSYVTATHPRAEEKKQILVLSAPTQAELDAMKAIYADKTNYRVRAEESIVLYVNTLGLTSEEVQTITWQSLDQTFAKLTPYTDPGTGNVVYNFITLKGVRPGETSVFAQYGSQKITFKVMVFPKGSDLSDQPSEMYFTTGNNVVVLKAIGDEKTIAVTPVGLPPHKYSEIVWTNSDQSIARVAANGKDATITALKLGEAKITVTHPDSQNTLTMYVRVGDAYVYNNNDTVYITTSSDSIQAVRGAVAQKLTAQLVHSSMTNNFTFEIDKPSVASLQSSGSGTCMVTPREAGQAMITVSHPAAKFKKQVLVLIGNSQEELDGIRYLSTPNNVVSVGMGQKQTVSAIVKNAPDIIIDGYTWQSADPAVASVEASGAQALVHGNSVGTTRLTVKNDICQYPLEIIVVVVDQATAEKNPYITTPTTVLTLSAPKHGASPAQWTTVTAELVGGSALDQQSFTWQVQDPSIAQALGQGSIAKVRASTTGTTRLTVSHPKAQYPCNVLLICDPKPESNCYISVPESIITMKPSEGDKSIVAQLVNGAAEDKYAFKWYADTYDVVDLTYSANVASIKPLAQGQTTIHITHPKAAYEQTVVVKVSEYTQFSFGVEFTTITQGQTSFIYMKVPTTSIPCHIEYESLNTKLCTIQGTNKVAQISGVEAGQTRVKAKLVATRTNVVQAQDEILVNVEKSDENTNYISCPKTVYSIEKNTSYTIPAQLHGKTILPQDEYNLMWKSSDPTIVSLVGASSTGTATGPHVMLRARNHGECTLTISHDKVPSHLVLKIIVPSNENQTIALDKTYIRLETGNRVEVKATISDAKIDDYKSIVWDISKPDGETIAELLGSGRQVAVYARKHGKAKLRATLPNGNYAECEVLVENARQLTFKVSRLRVFPGETQRVAYTVSPSDASIDWTSYDNDIFSYTIDAAAGEVIITGKTATESPGSLLGITNYGNKATLSVTCSWDYSFSLGKTLVATEPRVTSVNKEAFVIPFTSRPENCKIFIDNSKLIDSFTVDMINKTITLVPTGAEGSETLKVTVQNPNDNNRLFGGGEIQVNLEYKNLRFIPRRTSSTGQFSGVNNGILEIGDGEKVDFDFVPDDNITLVNENGDPIPMLFEFKPTAAGSSSITYTGNTTGASFNHPNDHVEMIYAITEDNYFADAMGNRIPNERLKWRLASCNGKYVYWKEQFDNMHDNEKWITYTQYYELVDTTTGQVYASVGKDTGCFGTGIFNSGTAQYSAIYNSQRKKILTAPEYVSQADFKANPHWYIPDLGKIYYPRKGKSWQHNPDGEVSEATWTDHNQGYPNPIVTSFEYILNPSKDAVPSHYTNVIKSVQAGTLKVSSPYVINKKTLYHTSIFQVQIVTRPCKANP